MFLEGVVVAAHPVAPPEAATNFAGVAATCGDPGGGGPGGPDRTQMAKGTSVAPRGNMMRSATEIRGAILALAMVGALGCSAGGSEEADEATSEDALQANRLDTTKTCGWAAQKWAHGLASGRDVGQIEGSAGLKNDRVYLRFRAAHSEDRAYHNNAVIKRIFPDGTSETATTADNFIAHSMESKTFRPAGVRWSSGRTPTATGMKYEVTLFYDIPNVKDPSCTVTLSGDAKGQDTLQANQLDHPPKTCGWAAKKWAHGVASGHEAGQIEGSAGLKNNEVYLAFRSARSDDRGYHNNAIIKRTFPSGMSETASTTDDFIADSMASKDFRAAGVRWPSRLPPAATGMKYEVTLVYDITKVRDPSCTVTLGN